MKRNVLLAVACVACLWASGAARAEPVSSDARGAAVPRVLSAEDVRRYREIFADEAEGRFADGRALIAGLSDRSLMGYVEAEHYLSPYGKRVALADLAAWLDAYAELPIAERIRALAESRNHRRHHKVELAGIPAIPHRSLGGGYEISDSIADPPLASDAARTAQVQIGAEVKLGQPATAETILQQLVSSNGAPSSDVARLTEHVAASYLAEGQDDQALRLAGSIAGADRQAAPMLDWDTGLAAYRLRKFADAAPAFEQLAQNGAVPGWTRSSGAFWAARARLAAGDPISVVSLLTAAAREQPTFYGLLAARMLGQETPARFSDPVLDSTSFATLMRIPAARRAVALWQVGRTESVQPEMARAFSQIDLNDSDSFAALSNRLDLPDLELRASEAQAARGVLLSGLFPVPGYTPPGGYHVDPCLVLAFARVESMFQARAVSTAGARGVMQLMPGTAAHVDGAMPGRASLNDPGFNLGLGERYLQELLGQTNGNLFQLAAAYNAGPGALNRWLGSRPEMDSDPLLFIESVPATQTRSYIKHVMTYYWLYSLRTKEEASSLDDTAEGKWPLYRPATPAPAATPRATPAGTALISDASTPH